MTAFSSVAGRFRHRMRVGYADTDQARIAHHSAFLRWLEQARVEYFRAIGVTYGALELDERLALPVVRANLRYASPARFDEELELET